MLIFRALQAIKRRLETFLIEKNRSRFFQKCRGVIHIGANSGSEAYMYSKNGLNVLWIEPVEEIFYRLQQRIKPFANQRAMKALITDKSGISYDFHIADNDGASSSILEFKMHKDIWPGVKFVKTVKLSSITLSDLLVQQAIHLNDYDCLVIDTQGSELMVLQGASDHLNQFSYIMVEAANFESYQKCCTDRDIGEFLSKHQFKEIRRECFAKHKSGGSYFNLTYMRLG